MALNSNALCTLATALDELKLSSDSGAQDARVERYINAASSLIARICNRRFERADAITENLIGRGTPFLFVERVPVLSITSVVLDGSTLAATDYELREVSPGVDGKLFRRSGWPAKGAAMVGPTFGELPGYEAENVVLTYSGGWVTAPQAATGGAFDGETVTLPADLEDACVMLAATRWQSRGRDRSVSAQQNENAGYTFGGVPVPPEVMAILDGYRRWASS